MSSITKQLSFRLVRRSNIDAVTISKHKWLYNANDLASMHGKLGILAEMGGVQGLAAAFRTDIKAGLFGDEVATGDFAKRKGEYGVNSIPRDPPTSFLMHCWEGLKDPVLIILCIAGVISLALGAIEDPSHGWYEGVAILLAVVLVTFVGAGQNMSQEAQFRKLDNEKEPEKSVVFRAGKSIKIDQAELLVGDIVLLSAGDEIPADGVLVSDEPIKCNESKLTGEAIDIPKNFDKPFLLSGTEVRQGECIMLVTAVGRNCAYGRIMESLATEQEDTPLQVKLEKVLKLISFIGTAVATTLFIIQLIGWGVGIKKAGKNARDEAHLILDFFITAVTIIVVAIPEGLPLAVTVSLAYSMKKMYNDQCLVRVLSACETMGNATTICSDKTGTLTTNKMTVVKAFLNDTLYDTIPETVDASLKELLIQGVVVNSKANTDQDNNDKTQEPENWTWKEGNQTEIALVAWLVRYDIHLDNERDACPVEKSYPFDSIKKQSSVIVKMPNGSYRRYFKGASEKVLAHCSQFVGQDGKLQAITDEKQAMLNETIHQMTCKGLRTIGFSYIDLPTVERDDADKIIDPVDSNEQVFFGVVGIKDPLRAESKLSVEKCQKAGIVVRMVTGDHVDTARFIAEECGILTGPDHIAMTGDEFRKLVNGGNAEELERVIPNLRVLARSKPEDKETLVNWLKDHGEVVAATGDGTNDAPALKAANVGIAMFIVGTQVAKSAAEINILDDNFASIVRAAMWGRSVFDNIRKFVQFQLTVNLVALGISLIGGLSVFWLKDENGEPAENTTPLKAVQLLWVNLIMDTMAALALGTEIPTEALLNRAPYEPTASIVSPVMWRNILGQTVLQLVVLMTILYKPDAFFGSANPQGIEPNSTHHYTLIFNTFVWLQIFNEINSRKVNEEMNVFTNFWTNYVFHGVLVITIILQFLMTQYAGGFAETVPLNLQEWFICIGLGAFAIVWGFFVRLIKVNTEAGRRVVPDKTFEGADWLLAKADAAEEAKPLKQAEEKDIPLNDVA